MSLYIISDLHISSSRDPFYGVLCSIISETIKPNDTLVLAGDVFDVFLGAKQLFRDRYSEFLTAVNLASSRNVSIHIIEGNHDFMFESAFSACANLKIHSEALLLELFGKKIWIAHGDLVDRGDVKYRLLRGLFRSYFMSIAVAVIPGSGWDFIGNTLSQRYSANEDDQKAVLLSELPLLKQERVRSVFRKFVMEKAEQGYDFIVLGHCHDQDEYVFKTSDNRKVQYINVGYPKIHGTMLKLSEGDEQIRRIPMKP